MSHNGASADAKVVLSQEFSRLVANASAQIQAELNSTQHPDDDVSAEPVFMMGEWVTRHGLTIYRALQRDEAIERLELRDDDFVAAGDVMGYGKGWNHCLSELRALQ